MRWRTRAAAAVLVTALVGALSAQKAATQETTANERPPGERVAGEPATAADFIRRSLRAAEKNHALLRLAAEQAENPRVKAFAHAIAADLDARRRRLRELAPPDSEAARVLSDRAQAEAQDAPVAAAQLPFKRLQYQRLRALKGAAFDKQFLGAVALGYEQAIRRYETEIARDDKATRAFAEETLPQLRRRRDEARALLADLDTPQD